MVIIWSLLVVVLLFLVACFFVSYHQSKELSIEESRVEEALWQRRHRIPLLLELAKDQIGVNRETIVLMRADLQTSKDSTELKIEREREFKTVISHMLDVLQKSEKHLVLLSSMSNEFVKIDEEISRAVNDYNFVVEKWEMRNKLPWFKLINFVFKKSKKARISLTQNRGIS